MTTAGTSSLSDFKLDSRTLCTSAAACICCCCVFVFGIGLLTSFLVSIFGTITTDADEYVGWAVVADAKECSEVSQKIIDDGGSIGDIAVAVMLCMGITAPHRMGIGGGFIGLFYNQSSQQVRALRSLGRSPSAAKPDMFGSNHSLYKTGATSVIVPGAMDGYELIHSELGALEWYRLFDPAIQLASEGFVVGRHLAHALERHSAAIEASADLKTRFWNTATNTVLREGDLLVQGTMADTLSDLAINGADFLYEGALAKEIVESTKAGGGSISAADMRDYEADWMDPISVNLKNDLVFHSAPSPGSGTLLGAAVAQVSLEYSRSEEDDPVTLSLTTSKELHKLVESLKFAFARRGELGDEVKSRDKEKTLLQEIIDKTKNAFKSNGPLPTVEDYGLKHPFVEDYGGAHLCILAPNGDAFAITSSLNNEFGSMFTTTSGLLLNNYMDAFAKHAESGAPAANLLGPSKAPMTSMAPVIITKKSSVFTLHSLFGGSGGMAGLSAVAQLITCAADYPYRECVLNEARLHPILVGKEFVVNVDGKNPLFDAKRLLMLVGQNVTERRIPSTAVGVMPTRRGSFLAINDTNHADGSNAGGRFSLN